MRTRFKRELHAARAVVALFGLRLDEFRGKAMNPNFKIIVLVHLPDHAEMARPLPRPRCSHKPVVVL